MLISQKHDESVEKSETQLLELKWHLTKDFLGVSSFTPSKGGFLSFYTKKGGKPFFSSKVRESSSPSCLCWHPVESLLVVGWQNGQLCMIDPNGKLLTFYFESRQKSTLKFSTMGNIVDETPTDVCSKYLNKKFMESLISDKRAKLSTASSSDFQTEIDKKNILRELLNKHKKFMEFEEEKHQNFNNIEETFFVFLIATNKGGLFVFDPETAQLFRIFQADSGLRQILDFPGKSFVAAISEEMMFYQLTIESRLANDKIKVKLSGKNEHFSMIRIDSSVLAICYGERDIRVWDLENQDSATLGLNPEKGFDNTEIILFLTYSAKKDSISGATNAGKMATWRRQRSGLLNGISSTHETSIPIEQQWRLLSAIQLSQTQINNMAWSHTSSAALAINSSNFVQIFISQGIDFFVDLHVNFFQLEHYF